MNAESRAKIINDDRPSIIDSKTIEPINNKVAVNLITRTLNLHGREQTAVRQKLAEVNTAKKTNMSWLDKLSSTTFVKGEVIGTELKVKGIVQNKSAFLKEIDNMEFIKDTSFTKPTFGDLDKQRRFEQYLKFSENERKLKFASIQPLSLTDWERDQEAQEFEKTARLCENVDKTAMSKLEKKEEKSTVDIKQYIESMSLEDRMAAAAEMKMFGKLTRTESEWKPAKLVCVRFNIAEPLVGVAVEDTKKKKFSIFDNLAWNEMSKFEKEKHIEQEFEPKPSTSSGFGYTDDEPNYHAERAIEEASIKIKSEFVSQKDDEFEDSYKNIFKKGAKKNESFKINNDIANIEPKKSENPAENMNVEEKKDLYKSIFLSSSEESESETEEAKNIDDEKLKAALIGKTAVELNIQRNTSPPRGIFAKLDLDNLLKRPEKMNSSQEKFKDINKVDENNGIVDSKLELKVEENLEVKMDGSDLPQDVYGPALPKVLLKSNDFLNQKADVTEVLQKNNDIDDSQWVEKRKNKKKSKKEKKKHKHKERSKSKSRKKSKKEKKY
jgi:G patch domain-containing protein 1